jgi:hypothetical protein
VVDADPMVRGASPAALAVPLQNLIPDPTKEPQRVPPLPVTGVAEAGGEGRKGAAGAEEGELARIPFPIPAKPLSCFLRCQQILRCRLKIGDFCAFRGLGSNGTETYVKAIVSQKFHLESTTCGHVGRLISTASAYKLYVLESITCVP